jgi:hypothetical protein
MKEWRLGEIKIRWLSKQGHHGGVLRLGGQVQQWKAPRREKEGSDRLHLGIGAQEEDSDKLLYWRKGASAFWIRRATARSWGRATSPVENHGSAV